MADSSTPALVTGASGFVGSAVARALIARTAPHKMFFDSVKVVRALAKGRLKDAVVWFRRARRGR
jgi:uncharacterized protein YbjT (DUF2867 family)